MKLALSENLTALAKGCPFPLYVVGGFVRDALAGLDAADVDICAPADTDEFVKVAENCGAKINAVYKNTGTVKLKFGAEAYEFTCFRSDEYVRGAHRPVKTFFTDDMLLDARRRDFKCNAVYYDIGAERFCDPLGGIADIEQRRLTTVADADKVFGEDGLRLMRLARQSAQTGFAPDGECLSGAAKNAALISDVSAERIYAELNAILHADLRYGKAYGQYGGLTLLDKTGVLDFILPELTAGRGMAQPEEFHSHDVLEHSLRAVKYADPSVRLAALLHDIGKPYCKITRGTYHGHETEGARIAAEVCARLKVPKKLAVETARLCEAHMYDLRLDARENKVRKFIVKNFDIYEKLLLLKQADYSACKDDLSEAPCVSKWKEIYGKMKREGAPFNLKELKTGGGELAAAGVPKDRIGVILGELLTDCAMEPKLNDAEKLLKRALAYAERKEV